MKRTSNLIATVSVSLLVSATAFAAGPYSPDAWPPTIDSTKKVHFYCADALLTAPNENWTNSVGILPDGDQRAIFCNCEDKGFWHRMGTTTYLNIADTNYVDWATEDYFDVLMLVYGDEGLTEKGLGARPRTVRFQEGSASPSTFTPPGFPIEAFNYKWNWVLYNLTNGWFTNAGVGYHLVGNIKPGSSASGSINGGVNKGTLRLVSADGSFAGFRIRAVAIGQKGAFGTREDINLFEAKGTRPGCTPPEANLVGVDFNARTTNYLDIVNGGDSTVEELENVGPANDLRRAMRPTWFNGSSGYLLNFAILSNYLGEACADPTPVRICADFYDDPAFAGMGGSFGPEAYAINPCGQVEIYPSASRHPLTGSGKWIRRSWIVPAVNLFGVNTSPNTGGPRLLSGAVQVAVSRVEIAVLRQTGPLAGQDPLAGCPLDPTVCEGVYTNYAELDFQNGIINGIDQGTANTEQNWVVELAGPTGEQRQCIAPSIAPNYYLNFQILNNAFGPNAQGNARIAIAMTYYDDPAQAGKRFGIDAWTYSNFGAEMIYASSPDNWITLAGTGKWRDAYWEIDRLTFTGVNQKPQAACRFKAEAAVHISRIRYAIVRDCGAQAGQNVLEGLKVTTLSTAPDNGLVRLNWDYREPQIRVETQETLGGAWSLFQGAPVVPEGEQAVVRVEPTNSAAFFRLARPQIP